MPGTINKNTASGKRNGKTLNILLTAGLATMGLSVLLRKAGVPLEVTKVITEVGGGVTAASAFTQFFYELKRGR